MLREVQARLQWIRMYLETQDAGVVCRRCGISYPTLRKWLRRYEAEGFEGLQSRSRRPHRFPLQKVTQAEQELILQLRRRNLGARRIQSELIRHAHLPLSLRTIHKVLTRCKALPLRRAPRKHRSRRYVRPIPGERIQMDVFKIRPGLYQYTSVDDCTRYCVLALYPRRTAKATLAFLEKVLEEMPFPIQRIQTDRGREFFATKVQQRLMDWGIKFRPIKPGAPHLNGKVERSQRTDWEEFYSTVDLNASDLSEQVQEWNGLT